MQSRKSSSSKGFCYKNHLFEYYIYFGMPFFDTSVYTMTNTLLQWGDFLYHREYLGYISSFYTIYLLRTKSSVEFSSKV